MMHKEQMYKTAYSPLFETYVGIDRAYQDSNGEWIYVCHSSNGELKDHLFRPWELTDFVL